MCRETTSLNLAKLRGVTFVNQYVVIKYLGKGANGRVFLCLDMCDNRLYAVKVPKPHRITNHPGSSWCVHTLVIPSLKSRSLTYIQILDGQAAAVSSSDSQASPKSARSILWTTRRARVQHFVSVSATLVHACADCEEGGHGVGAWPEEAQPAERPAARGRDHAHAAPQEYRGPAGTS